MLFRSVRSMFPLCSNSGRKISLNQLLTTRNFPGVFSDSASLFRLAHSAAAEKRMDSVLNSVVKISTVSSKPDHFHPWQNMPQRRSRGSGFVISGKRIITNAHVVDNHKLVQVIKQGSPKKYIAQVKAIGHECDLAILVIENKEFWEDLNPLELGDIPFLEDSVVVVGYPQGGDNISITKGVVSRIESRKYYNVHDATKLLVIQIDAAINPGNSGGPVVIGNKVVGVAFQGFSFSHSNDIGYIIPTPVIKHFISGAGFCSMNLSYQPMKDEQIRSHFKMNPLMTGILVNHINPLSDAHKILKKDDIVLAIDGVSIGNDGTVILRNEERVAFDHLVSMKNLDETTLLKILRNGETHEFSITLKPVRGLAPTHQFDNIPSYYIFAGFVFMPLTQQHISRNNDLRKLGYKHISSKTGGQIVIISQVLADVVNAEYDMFKNLKVESVNNVKVENLKHLYKLVEECCTKDLRLDLGHGRVIILDYELAKNSTPLILERHRVPSAMSKDLS